VVFAGADLTRASGGNLDAKKVVALADSVRNRAVLPDYDEIDAEIRSIANAVAATGGTDAESVAAAIARARDGREHAARAVTLDDHVALAFETPGARLARVEAFANFHPGFPCLTASGIVTVLILPFLPPHRPAPSAGLRHVVSTYLNRRRVIGSRVEVAAPVYVTVTVHATVETRPEARSTDVQAAIRAALDDFFHPLTGGADGAGWPFGRDVYRSEVLQVIDDVPGVAHVLSLELGRGDGCPTCGNLCIGPTGLVDSGPHEIGVR
jgi:predicted phage baseplate assembly protein